MARQVYNKMVEFFYPPPICKMPGCNKQGYVENNGYVHEFCGKTHAREYKAMKDADKQKMMRDKRLKAVQHGGWQGQHSYSAAAAAPAYGSYDGSYTRSGASYGAYNMVSQPTVVTNHYGNMGHGPIRFYDRDEPYYEFTNFYQAPIILDDKTWPTTEHYFQAQKFIGTSYSEMIRKFDRPRQAFDLSRNPTVSRWRRKDWEDIKIDIMRKALLAKFTQHKDLRQLLLHTEGRYLIEHTPYDKFWGNGGDDSGENHLGLLLMEIRQLLVNLQASLYKPKEAVVLVQPRITPDSHRDSPQRIESMEKDGPNGLSSSSSCSMDYTNAGAGKSNPSCQSHPSQDGDLTRPPLHPVNTGLPPCQQPAATGGKASPQVNTPVPTSTSEPSSDPPVGNLIDLEDPEPPKDKVTSMITGNVPPNLAVPIQPTPPAPSHNQYTTQHIAGQCTTPAAPDTTTGVGKEPSSLNDDDQLEEKMDTH